MTPTGDTAGHIITTGPDPRSKQPRQRRYHSLSPFVHPSEPSGSRISSQTVSAGQMQAGATDKGRSLSPGPL